MAIKLAIEPVSGNALGLILVKIALKEAHSLALPLPTQALDNAN